MGATSVVVTVRAASRATVACPPALDAGPRPQLAMDAAQTVIKKMARAKRAREKELVKVHRMENPLVDLYQLTDMISGD
jgi:hypothetical protein